MCECIIHWQDGIKRIEAQKGERLIDILHRAGVTISAPCGGRCFCGKCRVRVAGETDPCHEAELNFTTPREREMGWRLACACHIEGDAEVWVDEAKAEILLDGGLEGEAALAPAVWTREIAWEAPSLRDQRSDEVRLLEALDLPEGAIDPAVLKALPDLMRENERLTVAVYEDREVVSAAPGSGRCLGVAVDVGTTTLAAYLIDLQTGRQLDAASMLNPQRPFGGDVISRTDYTIENPDGLREMAGLVRDAVDGLIGRMTESNGLSRAEVRQIVLVGNTIMMHLFAALPAKNIAVLPFIPAYARAFTRSGACLGMAEPEARVTLGPCVAGYVGADTIAAILACDMDEKEAVSLMIDIGTNGEIALGGRGEMLCCSAAAGPAFEGAHIRCGSGAVAGAIDHVQYENGALTCTTIGGQKAASICGSGLVDAVATLLEAGIIDETGRIDEDEAPEELCLDVDGKCAIRLAEDVFLCQKDVREVQLAKGAIAAGIQVLLEELGIAEKDIAALYLAGGFGNFIDADSACQIGLLPAGLRAKIRPIGNGAGAGAKKMLMNRQTMARAEALRKRMRYIELSARPDFQELFAENMMFD